MHLTLSYSLLFSDPGPEAADAGFPFSRLIFRERREQENKKGEEKETKGVRLRYVNLVLVFE